MPSGDRCQEPDAGGPEHVLSLMPSPATAGFGGCAGDDMEEEEEEEPWGTQAVPPLRGENRILIYKLKFLVGQNSHTDTWLQSK